MQDENERIFIPKHFSRGIFGDRKPKAVINEQKKKKKKTKQGTKESLANVAIPGLSCNEALFVLVGLQLPRQAETTGCILPKLGYCSRSNISEQYS